VPIDKLDLRLVQIMYTTGDMAAIRALSPFEMGLQASVVCQVYTVLLKI
jgi:hypothetical protein